MLWGSVVVGEDAKFASHGGGDGEGVGLAVSVEAFFDAAVGEVFDEGELVAAGAGGVQGSGPVGMSRPDRVPSLVWISTSTSVGSRPCWTAVRMTLPMILAA